MLACHQSQRWRTARRKTSSVLLVRRCQRRLGPDGSRRLDRLAAHVKWTPNLFWLERHVTWSLWHHFAIFRQVSYVFFLNQPFKLVLHSPRLLCSFFPGICRFWPHEANKKWDGEAGNSWKTWCVSTYFNWVPAKSPVSRFTLLLTVSPTTHACLAQQVEAELRRTLFLTLLSCKWNESHRHTLLGAQWSLMMTNVQRCFCCLLWKKEMETTSWLGQADHFKRLQIVSSTVELGNLVHGEVRAVERGLEWLKGFLKGLVRVGNIPDTPVLDSRSSATLFS